VLLCYGISNSALGFYTGLLTVTGVETVKNQVYLCYACSRRLIRGNYESTYHKKGWHDFRH
jgi:hypothetical protein